MKYNVWKPSPMFVADVEHFGAIANVETPDALCGRCGFNPVGHRQKLCTGCANRKSDALQSRLKRLADQFRPGGKR